MKMEVMEFWAAYKDAMTHNPFVILVLLCVAADTFFGCLRAAKFHAWNSSLGIDGGIRKVTMICSVLFLSLADQLVGINVMGWLPEGVAAALGTIGVNALGLAEFFCVVYVCYEAASILKNMLLCGVPAPAGLQNKLAKWLDQMTDESTVSVTQTLQQHNKTQVPKNKSSFGDSKKAS